MKRIRGLDAPTPGLSDYVAGAAGEADWEGFRSHRRGASYRELVESLIDLQHRLCAYCEIELGRLNRQIEHVVPRSHSKYGAARALDPANLAACCLGGTRETDDRPRFRLPIADNMSCGQRKGDRTHRNFVDPRDLPEIPSLTRVRPDGLIEADEYACTEQGRSSEAINQTIDLLGLNVERLKVARAALWRALHEGWRDCLEDGMVMRAAAREALLPNDGGLPEFFTTRRSYFSGWGGEEVLSEEPRAWI